MVGASFAMMGHGFGGPFHGGRFMDRLTAEQRAEIHDMAEEMFREGASPCDVHDAVREKVEGYGIELTEPPGHELRRIATQLTEEQRAEIYGIVDQMFLEGASPCEIHDAVREKVEGYGIELPEMPWGRHHHGKHMP
jgi:hypothetical protein